MSRKRKRPSRRWRGVNPADIQIREADAPAVEEFFRFGGPAVFPCGCSAYDATRIAVNAVGTDAYPVGDGLTRSDVKDFRRTFGEPMIWWHDCPDRENVVLRSPIETG